MLEQDGLTTEHTTNANVHLDRPTIAQVILPGVRTAVPIQIAVLVQVLPPVKVRVALLGAG